MKALKWDTNVSGNCSRTFKNKTIFLPYDCFAAALNIIYGKATKILV